MIVTSGSGESPWSGVLLRLGAPTGAPVDLDAAVGWALAGDLGVEVR